MRKLNEKCKAEFSNMDQAYWSEILALFQDANLYQTWSYDMARYGQSHVVHMVLKKEGKVAAAAEARVLKIPGIKLGIAYVRGGPLWRLSDRPADPEVFQQAIRALKNEYLHTRGLIVRLHPQSYAGQFEGLEDLLHEEGYECLSGDPIEQTLILDLSPSIKDLRANLDQKWRNRLNRAENSNLELACGDGDELFHEVEEVYWQMVRRKKLHEPGDIDHLRKVQRRLSPGLKLKTMVCRLNGETCAGGVFSAIGDTGVYLIGATSDLGLKTNGSYMVQWAFVKWLKENGFSYYDLNGINPKTNPGTYHFKKGIAGKLEQTVSYMGRFQAGGTFLSARVVKTAEWLLHRYRKVRHSEKTMRHAPTERHQ